MASLKRNLNKVALVSALVLSNGAVSSGVGKFPLELGMYEYRAVYCEDVENIGTLEEKIVGDVTMNVRKTEAGYSVDFGVKARPVFPTLKFSNSSYFEISDSYGSLNNNLETYFYLFGFGGLKTSDYSFDDNGEGVSVRIKNSATREDRQFDIPSNTYGPLATFARFFSGNQYMVEGDHYLGKMKGDKEREARDVFANVKREGNAYLARVIVPKNVFQKSTVPVTVYYTEGEDRANIFRVDAHIKKITRCFSALRAED